ncbi:MAG TPA: multiheme c-type cytochrome [Pirellulales bacterium]|nr:multiheme c-type cytochrome [Pirellulales bacterium]
MLSPARVATAALLVLLALANCQLAHSDPPAKPSASAKRATAKRSAPIKKPEKPAARPDPVEQNGPIFKDWPKPKLALVLTGEQLGYIEPCGCAGLENQKGGLRRRHTFLKQLEKEGWPVIALDNGGLIRRFGREAEIKYRKTAEGLKTMGYNAIGFGVEDLKLPGGALASAVVESELFVSANVSLFAADFGFPQKFVVAEAGGMKVGVTGVLGDRLQKQVTNNEVVFQPAKKALAEVVPELKKAKCDLYVLLSYADIEETTALAKAFPLFQVVLMAHGADEPPHESKKVSGTNTLLVEVAHKGMYAITLGFYDDKSEPVRYQRVPLDHRFADSPEMDELMVNYQEELKELGWNGLGLRTAPHPGGDFVGSESCADCHDKEFNIWRQTPHAHATETLTRAKPPRQFDPECISCHATGWNPQEFFPYRSGYESLKATPLLAGSGCENCHGPGAEHVAAENGDNKALQRKLRELLKRTSTGAAKEAQRDNCMRCHDIDNSPDFDFDAYWDKVKH